MRIKSLFISGFKSFVEATEIKIDSGLTAIVGPNGCGKSNLVDAVRWVTGESSARKLRGDAMDDFIFAGADTAPASSVARVSLTIDELNGEGPAIFSGQEELHIERRIKRGSGSDFRVNGRPVRAADVKLIFSDVGAGADSPGMVSQGRVAALLAARPHERRRLLEEAAEVSGLDQRRHEAEGRIRRTEANLTRIEDALRVMVKQREALVEQAESAKLYRQVSAKIRQFEAAMLVITWRKAKDALATAGQKLQLQDDVVLNAAKAVTASRKLREDQAHKVEHLRFEVKTSEESAREAREALTALVRRQDQAEMRLETARTQSKQLEQDRAREIALMSDCSKTLEARNQQYEDMSKRLSHLQSLESGATVEAQKLELTHLLKDAQDRLEDTRTKEAARRAEISSKQQSLHQATERLKVLKTQIAHLDEACNTATTQLEDEDISSLEQSLTAAEKTLSTNENLLHTRRDELAKASTTTENQHKIVRDFESMASGQRAEIDAIQSLLAAESKTEDNSPALVSEARASEGLEHALGAALGTTALAGRSGENYWRLLPSLPPAEEAVGVIPLAKYVHAPKEWSRLLSQVWIVKNVAYAEDMQASLAPGQSLVTRDGGLWRWDGFVRKPGALDPAAHLLEQAARHDELAKALQQTTQDLETAHTTLKSCLKTQDHAKTGLAEAEALVSASRDTLRKAERAVLEVRTRTSRLQANLETSRAERERTHTALFDQDQLIEELHNSLSDLEATQLDEGALNRLHEEAETRRQHLAEVTAEANRIQADLESTYERAKEIQEDIESWEARAKSAQSRLEDIDQRLTDIKNDMSKLEQAPEKLVREIEAQTQLSNEASSALDTRRQNLGATEADLTTYDSALMENEVAFATAQERRTSREVELAARRDARDTAVAEIRKELSSSPAQAIEIAGFTNEDETPSTEKVSHKLSRLQQERDAFGPVNLLAEQQLIDIETTLTKLESEQSDLRDALNRFSEALSELEAEARRRLKQVFEKLNQSFKMLFSRLFDGGEAYLALSGEDDPLHAGLEVFACPPGKRLQTMSLMSGGEQALTALALIFSMFLVRPGPLCVLDEVDAPLDDANVERFCNLVQSLSQEHGVRFLIITHHRLTMARVNRLIGVTMPNEGRSQIVSVNLEEALKWSEDSL